MRCTYSLFFFILFCFSCQQEPQKTPLKPLNLLKHDIPLTIMAPDSAVVKTMDLLVKKDVSIKAGDDYYVQIFAGDASTTNTKIIVEELKRDAETNPYFSRIINEDDNGFIYETMIDSTFSYKFRQVRIQGDREYIFQTGLIGSFTLDEVKTMYDAVKPVK